MVSLTLSRSANDRSEVPDTGRRSRRARERFLCPDEIHRVVAVLNRYDETRPLQAAVIRPSQERAAGRREGSCGEIRSGCRPPRDRSWTGYLGIPHGSFHRVGRTWTICRISQVSGGTCARKPICATSGRTTSSTVMHYNHLSNYYECIYFVSVSIRNHIVTGFNPYPDATCRARPRHHGRDRSNSVTVRPGRGCPDARRQRMATVAGNRAARHSNLTRWSDASTV